MYAKRFTGMFGDAWPSMARYCKIFLPVLVVYLIIFTLSGIKSETVLYFSYAEQMVSGNMPYSDFAAEYPPFAMLLILVPRFFSWDPLSYQVAFSVLMFLFMLAGAYFVYMICEDYTDRPGRCVDVYLLFSLILIDFVLDRYDAAPMVMALAALYLLLKGKEDLGWILLALAAMTKLYPALLAPVVMIWIIRRGRIRDAARGLVICAIVCVVCMLPFIIADPGTAFSFLTYHAERGLQTESVVASFIMVLSELGLTEITYMFEYGSDNIYGALPDLLDGAMMPLLAVVLVAVYVVFYRITGRENGDGRRTVLMACFAVTLAFMVVNKVLSSQYLVWIIPYMVMLFAMLPADRWKVSGWIFIAAVALTQLNMVVNYALRTGTDFSTVGVMIIFLRNLLLLWLSWKLIKNAVKSIREPAVDADGV